MLLPLFRSDRRETKRMKLEPLDVHLSDVSDHYVGDVKFEEEDNARSSARSPSPSPRDAIYEQVLRLVTSFQYDIMPDYVPVQLDEQTYVG